MEVVNTASGAVTRIGYDRDGARVWQTNGTTTTVYIGALAEITRATTSLYIAAYTFENAALADAVAEKAAQGVEVKVLLEGKPVGGLGDQESWVAQRIEEAGGVVYWLHADHLGSTTLATGIGGNRVGELRYYPYGGTRYSWGTTPTSYRFTGQRQDATIGLYFYNARYYDPVLGRFISADTIVPEPGNPQSLNRYGYCLGNPLNFTDPSGHIAESEADDALKIIELLQHTYWITIKIDFGWLGAAGETWIEGDWELVEMETLLQGVEDLARVMGGAERFRENLGGVWVSRRRMENARGMADAHRVWLNADGFSAWTVVHELAHAWDAANGWQLSRGLEEFTGGQTVWEWHGLLLKCSYKFGGVPPKGADDRFNRLEDFAESVATFVYPGEAQAFIQQHFPPDRFPGFQYENYYQTQRALYVARQLNFDPQELRLWQKGW